MIIYIYMWLEMDTSTYQLLKMASLDVSLWTHWTHWVTHWDGEWDDNKVDTNARRLGWEWILDNDS